MKTIHIEIQELPQGTMFHICSHSTNATPEEQAASNLLLPYVKQAVTTMLAEHVKNQDDQQSLAE